MALHPNVGWSVVVADVIFDPLMNGWLTPKSTVNPESIVVAVVPELPDKTSDATAYSTACRSVPVAEASWYDVDVVAVPVSLIVLSFTHNGFVTSDRIHRMTARRVVDVNDHVCVPDSVPSHCFE